MSPVRFLGAALHEPGWGGTSIASRAPVPVSLSPFISVSRSLSLSLALSLHISLSARARPPGQEIYVCKSTDNLRLAQQNLLPTCCTIACMVHSRGNFRHPEAINTCTGIKGLSSGGPGLAPPNPHPPPPPPPPPPWPQPPNPNPELQPIAQFANADPWHNSPTQTFWLATTARRLAGQGAGREEKGQSAVEPTRQTPRSQPLDFQSKVLGGYADLAGDHGHSCPEHVASCLRLQAVAFVV